MLDYIFGTAWLVVAALLIFRFSKESKYFYLAGGWFALFGIWTIVDKIMDNSLNQGVLSWVFKGITLVVSVILIFVFLTERKTSLTEDGAPLDPADEPAVDDGYEYDPYMENGYEDDPDMADADDPDMENGYGNEPYNEYEE